MDADTLLAEPRNSDYFDAVLTAAQDIDSKKLAAFLLNTAMKRANEENTTLDRLGATPEQTAGLLALLQADKISSSAAEPLFGHCCDSDGPAETLAEKHGLLQVSDEGALDAWVDAALNDPKLAPAVADVKAGKNKAIGAIVGAVMKLSKGQANPKAVSAKINEKLSG